MSGMRRCHCCWHERSSRRREWLLDAAQGATAHGGWRREYRAAPSCPPQGYAGTLSVGCCRCAADAVRTGLIPSDGASAGMAAARARQRPLRYSLPTRRATVPRSIIATMEATHDQTTRRRLAGACSTRAAENEATKAEQQASHRQQRRTSGRSSFAATDHRTMRRCCPMVSRRQIIDRTASADLHAADAAHSKRCRKCGSKQLGYKNRIADLTRHRSEGGFGQDPSAPQVC